MSGPSSHLGDEHNSSQDDADEYTKMLIRQELDARMEEIDARIEEIMKERKDDDKNDQLLAAAQEENELTAIRIDELDDKYGRELQGIQGKLIGVMT